MVIYRTVVTIPSFTVVLMTDYMDSGYNEHQEADFAMNTSERGMMLSCYPYCCCSETGRRSQQKDPPQNTSHGILVFRKACEPVARLVVKVYVVK